MHKNVINSFANSVSGGFRPHTKVIMRTVGVVTVIVFHNKNDFSFKSIKKELAWPWPSWVIK